MGGIDLFVTEASRCGTIKRRLCDRAHSDSLVGAHSVTNQGFGLAGRVGHVLNLYVFESGSLGTFSGLIPRRGV